MIVTLLTDVRIYEINKSYYASAFYKILERYAKSFGKVILITRVVKSENVPKGYNCIDDYCSELIDVGSISHVFFSSNNRINDKIKVSDLVIIRLPSLTVMLLYKYIKQNKKIYLTEAMGCAWDAFWNHGLLGKVVAPYGFLKMKKIIKNANYATYVTDKFLQNRYPCSGKNIGVSNVDIKDIAKPRSYGYREKNKINLLTAAAVDVKYKGQKYVIEAISRLNKKGIKYDYYLIGGGKQDYLKKVAIKNRVEKQVHFLGSLSRDEVLRQMREMDYYIQPSLQEGLPRAVIEAMSRGCVCFGSDTAGIPELLDEQYIFKRRSVQSIVKKLSSKYSVYDLKRASERNISISRKFNCKLLDKKRYNFYRQIKKEIKNG